MTNRKLIPQCQIFRQYWGVANEGTQILTLPHRTVAIKTKMQCLIFGHYGTIFPVRTHQHRKKLILLPAEKYTAMN